MEMNGCELRIYGSTAPETNEGYVLMPDSQIYSIFIRNGFDTPCDAELKIDNNVAAVIRLNPYESQIIERPQNVNAKFRFKSSSWFSRNDPNAGLVQVKFIPHYYPQYHPPLSPVIPITQSMSPGHTVFSGSQSRQSFTPAPQTQQTQPDHSRAFTLSLRLVIEKGSVYPPGNAGNPVPPPVGP
jgi:hypothetical protein